MKNSEDLPQLLRSSHLPKLRVCATFLLFHVFAVYLSLSHKEVSPSNLTLSAMIGNKK